MAKLKEYNGRYCESEFESAFISFLEDEDGITFPETVLCVTLKLLFYTQMIWNSF